jgi:hypothetical protein
MLTRNFLFLLYLCLSVQSASLSTISNVAPRYDTLGRIVNSHDGCLVQLTAPGKAPLYYQYGTVYENCTQDGPICDGKCGYLGNLFSVYSSPDLESWTLISDNVLPELAKDNSHISYWEANVGYNAKTNSFIMLYWSGHYGFVDNHIAVATSTTPDGPFINTPPIAVRGASIISDTVALFVDDDGTAYARYNTRDLPYRHVIERLDSTWLNSTGESAIIFEKPSFPWYDGGGMFRRGDMYYVMLSFDCCFCQWGSDALVFRAPSPLGPWTPQPSSPLGSSTEQPKIVERKDVNSLDLGFSKECNLTGKWVGVLGGDPVGSPNLELFQSGNVVSVTGAVTTSAIVYSTNNSIVFSHFPGAGQLIATIGSYGNDTDGCSQLSWVDFTPNGSFWCRFPTCHHPEPPPANWTNEVNLCENGLQPPVNIVDMTVNPCSQNDVNGANFTVPAQQFSVSVLTNADGLVTYLFNGEHFRSAVDGIKAHDLQAWIPLECDQDGILLPMKWYNEFQVSP